MKVITDEDITQYKGPVHHIAKRFRNHRPDLFDYEDLVSAGYIGLIGAIRRFDPKLGFSFSTFACHTIHGEIRNHVTRVGRPVRAPRRIAELQSAIARKRLLHLPHDQIALKLGVSIKSVKSAIELLGTQVKSMDEEFDTGNGTVTLADQIGSYADHSKVHVEEFVSSLTDQERRVLILKQAGYAQRVIGDKIGCTQVHVSRILKRIGKKLNDYLMQDCTYAS